MLRKCVAGILAGALWCPGPVMAQVIRARVMPVIPKGGVAPVGAAKASPLSISHSLALPGGVSLPTINALSPTSYDPIAAHTQEQTAVAENAVASQKGALRAPTSDVSVNPTSDVFPNQEETAKRQVEQRKRNAARVRRLGVETKHLDKFFDGVRNLPAETGVVAAPGSKPRLNALKPSWISSISDKFTAPGASSKIAAKKERTTFQKANKGNVWANAAGWASLALALGIAAYALATVAYPALPAGWEFKQWFGLPASWEAFFSTAWRWGAISTALSLVISNINRLWSTAKPGPELSLLKSWLLMLPLVAYEEITRRIPLQIAATAALAFFLPSADALLWGLILHAPIFAWLHNYGHFLPRFAAGLLFGYLLLTHGALTAIFVHAIGNINLVTLSAIGAVISRAKR